MKKILIVVCFYFFGAGGAYGVLYFKRRPLSQTAAHSCKKHSLKACPFCDKSQIDKLGECKEHKVPEALCHVCRPELVAAFKIEGDWCGGHNLPESQCQLCGGSCAPKETENALCNKHKVPEKACPFCDESLIEKLGMCEGHKVPEALCSRCNKDLIPGFKAEGDWCAAHELPESQCKLCGAK